jgi:hypothetical protein
MRRPSFDQIVAQLEDMAGQSAVPLLLFDSQTWRLLCLPRRPSFDQIVAQLEDMAGQLDALKQQQAQQMAAAAAPLCAHGTASHPEPGELGHELTPSMMADLMPSGFSGGSSQHEELQEADGSGTAVYEMSQLSGCSDREHNH